MLSCSSGEARNGYPLYTTTPIMKPSDQVGIYLKEIGLGTWNMPVAMVDSGNLLHLCS